MFPRHGIRRVLCAGAGSTSGNASLVPMEKTGLGSQMYIHVQVNRTITVEAGHAITDDVQTTSTAIVHR